jgi:hypothetical protein
LYLDDYDTSVKLRQEIELFSDGSTRKANEEPLVREILQRWPIQLQGLSYDCRWSAIDEAKGIRFDLSIVQQSKRTSKGEYKWETTFQKQNFLKNPPVYEIEVELLHNDANSSEDRSLKKILFVGLARSFVEFRRMCSSFVELCLKKSLSNMRRCISWSNHWERWT